MDSDTSRQSGNNIEIDRRPLEQLSVANNEVEESLSRAMSSLPPIDRGRGAWWTFLACAFTLDLILWGLPYSFGVLEEYYLSTLPFSSASEQTINAIGTVAVALMHMLLIFIMPILTRINQSSPRSVTVISWWALCVCTTSLLLASFANSAWQLVLLQGVAFGSSASLVWSPIIVYLSQWFIERRALAAAVIFGGSSVGGAVFPPLLNYLLSRTGFRWTLRILSLIVALGGGISLLGVKPRVPVAIVPHSTTERLHPERRTSNFGFILEIIPDFSFAKSPLFTIINIAYGTQGLAYFTVALYLPSYAASVGLSPLNGTLALSVFNLCGVIGQVIYGYLCDKMPYTTVIMISGAGGAISAFLMWGFAGNDLALLFAFVVVFGTACGGFSSVAAPACSDLVGTGFQSGIVLAAMQFLRGVAIIIGPQIAALLRQNRGITKTSSSTEPTSLYGGYGFTAVEVFVGCGMLATAFGGGFAHFLRTKRRVSV